MRGPLPTMRLVVLSSLRLAPIADMRMTVGYFVDCYFVDNNKEIVGEKIEGVSVISFDKLKDIYENYEIVVTVDARKCKILANYGIQ